MILEDDVWIVGHGIVSPITAHKKSMLLVGGVIAKDMDENHVYGGTPAKDLTEHLGAQFVEKSIEEKHVLFMRHYYDFLEQNQIEQKEFCIKILDYYDDKEDFECGCSYYFVGERRYLPTSIS